MLKLLAAMVGLMLIAMSSYALEPFAEFTAANVEKAKSKAANTVKFSKEANDMLALMIKFAPGQKFENFPGFKIKYGSYEGKVGNIDISNLTLQDKKINNLNFQIKGSRIEEQIIPVLREIYGNPVISKKDELGLALVEGVAKLSNSEYHINDDNYINYKWDTACCVIELSANDSRVIEYTDGRRKVDRPKATKVIFYKK